MNDIKVVKNKKMKMIEKLTAVNPALEQLFRQNQKTMTTKLKNHILAGMLHPEDYHRAYHLLHFLGERIPNPKEPKPHEDRKQNLKAKAPEFLKDQDIRLVKDEESRQLTVKNTTLEQFVQKTK